MQVLPARCMSVPSSCCRAHAVPHRLLHRRASAAYAAPSRSEQSTKPITYLSTARHDPGSWQKDAASILQQLQLPPTTTPPQLWQHLAAAQPTTDPQQQLLKLDLASSRLLLSAAAATCSTQQQYNQLRPMLQAVVPVLPQFELADFRQLLQLCAQARIVPGKEWLATIYYADTGGLERLYKEVSWAPTWFR